MIVVCIVGMPGSGKSELAESAKFYGHVVVRIGDMVWSEVKARGLEINSENVSKIATEMRKRNGMDIWARRTVEYIKGTIKPNEKKIIVIDGVRNPEEIEYFRRSFGDKFFILAVHSSPKTRYMRLMDRGREDDSTDMESIKKRDERELSWGIGRVIAMADYMIVNEGSISDLHKAFGNIMSTIIKNGKPEGVVGE